MSEVETQDPLPEDEPTVPPPTRAPKDKRPPQQPREERSATADAIAREDDVSIGEFLTEIGSRGAQRFKLERTWPKEFDGHPIAGYLEEYDEPFTESDVKARFGGGKFYVRGFRKNPRGGWMHAGAKAFSIAGDPKLPDSGFGGGGSRLNQPLGTPHDNGDVSLQRQALATMERLTTDAQSRARDLEDKRNSAPKGTDDALLGVMRDQARETNSRIDKLTELLADKDQKILDLMGKKPETSTADRVLEKMIDGESARITALRAQHDSERNQLLQGHRDEVRSLRDSHKEELAARERAHEREIGHLRESNGAQIETLKQSYESRLDQSKHRISDLERSLTEAKAEVVTLREKKDKGPLDAMNEIAQLKNSMESLGLAGAEPAPWYEKIIDKVSDNPFVQAMASRMEAGMGPPQPPQPQGVRKRVVQRRAAGSATVAQPGGPQPVAGPPVTTRKRQAGPQMPPVDPKEAAIAVNFIETAVRNGTDPAQLAMSVRTMVPQSILDAIRVMGIDAFINQHVRLEDGSPLRSQLGRNFCRKFARFLIEGPEPEPEPASPPREDVIDVEPVEVAPEAPTE